MNNQKEVLNKIKAKIRNNTFKLRDYENLRVDPNTYALIQKYLFLHGKIRLLEGKPEYKLWMP
jgi:hypothetical protein